MAPPGFENFKSKWLPLPPRTPLAESTPSLVEAFAINTVGMMPERAAGSLPTLEAMDVEMDISPGLLPSLKSAEEGPLEQPLQGSSSLTVEAAPCSPDMPPPGFENYKPSWLPQPTLPPLAGTMYSLDVATTKGVAGTFAEKASSVLVLEPTDAETNPARNILPTLESGAGGSLQVPLPRPPSPTMQAAPCSPCMAPPGFENLKLQQLQLPSPPLAQTSYILQDSSATGASNVTSEEAPQSSPALQAMDVEMDAAPALPTPLESGARESL
uniref:Uncharacterized protein n=1 Tax=Arundo donax TaxID=35708 RepID=A0A0A9FLG7_ARUDO